MRFAVLLLLAACGDDPQDPHAEGTCDMGWSMNGFTSCELGCESSAIALGASGESCDAATVENIPVVCSKTFTFEGIVGCCSIDAVEMTEVHFAECQ